MASSVPGPSGQSGQHHQAQTVVQVEDDLRSEVSCDENGIQSIKLVHLVENLFVRGMTSLDKWEKGLQHMKTHPDVTGHPILLQVWFTLNQLFLTFYNHVHVNADPSQDKLPYFTSEEKSFDEIVSILKPMLNKKAYKDKVYSMDIVQKILAVINSASLLSEDNVSKSKKRKASNKKTKISKKSKKASSSSESSSSTSSSSASESEDSDAEDDKFGKIFTKSKPKHVVIHQTVHYNDGRKRRKITTPGETGTHLIKIEITDTKDLKNCSSEKTFWQKVSKKGIFLLNTKFEEDKALFKELDNILFKVGEKISKIKNAKHDVITVDSDAKRY